MYEHASVVSIRNRETITVSCETDTCANCQAGSFCATKGKTFVAHNGTDKDLSVGDTVEIYLPPGKTITAGFIALLVPILLFPIGYYLPSLFDTSAAEGIRIVGGIIGIAIGFLISRAFSKAKSKEYTPEVTRIIDEA